MNKLPVRYEGPPAHRRPMSFSQRTVSARPMRAAALVLVVYAGGRLHQFVKDARRLLHAGR